MKCDIEDGLDEASTFFIKYAKKGGLNITGLLEMMDAEITVEAGVG